MYKKLAPVGNRVSLAKSSSLPIREAFSRYHIEFLGSGTEALAAALLTAKFNAKLATQSTLSSERNEVLIPAYVCPDLIAAIKYVGLTARLVDLERDDAQISLAALREKLSEKTLAIIAVNFMGIAQRLTELKALAVESGCVLIEDNAQWFPELSYEMLGDMTIVSFGRGKPINVLSGGLLLVDKRWQIPPQICDLPVPRDRKFLFKAMAFNMVIAPWLYRWVTLLPGLSLGETLFRPLPSIRRMPFDIEQRLYACLERYRVIGYSCQQMVAKYMRQLDTRVRDLSLNAAEGKPPRLLRYPLLFPSESLRNRVFDALEKRGLGASKLYRVDLSQLAGVSDYLVDDELYPNAADFAGKLLTLPVHEFVSVNDVECMIGVINDELESRE